jgi:peptidoglycan/LPS O-acetylase OafA/YrhL
LSSPSLIPASTPAAPSGGTKTKLPSLTGMRWLAAFLVFGFHIGTLNIIETSSYHHKWDMIFGEGASGVSFFFVLSGFVLVWSARSGDTKLRFWRRRIAKIWPNHATTWAIVIALMLYWGDQVRPEVAVGNLFLIQPWILKDTFPYSINTVSWSLGCEAFFYLCFPFVLPLVKKAPVWALYASIGGLWLLMHWAAVTATHLPGTWPNWFDYGFPPVRSLEFWLGVVVGELVVRRRWNGPGLWGGTLVAVAVYTSTRGIPWFPIGMPTEWWGANLAVAFVILIAGAAQADITGARSPWRNRPIVFLGEISFAFYLVHVFFMEYTLRWLGRNGVGWSGGKAAIVIPAFLAVSIFLAWLLYRFVEVPMMRRLGPKRRPVAASTPAPAAAVTADAAVPAPRGPEPDRVDDRIDDRVD